MKKLPNTIYVYTEQDGADEYLVAFIDPKECVSLEEERLAGKYILDRTVKIVNTTDVVEIEGD